MAEQVFILDQHVPKQELYLLYIALGNYRKARLFELVLPKYECKVPILAVAQEKMLL